MVRSNALQTAFFTFFFVIVATYDGHSARDPRQPTVSEVQGTVVRRQNGTSDTSASVGYLFNYSIPDDAFTGPINRLEVTEAGETSLPSWIQYDPGAHSFEGVPMVSDIGLLYVCVKALGKTNLPESTPSIAKDVFSIEILLDSPNPCPEKESVTTAYVVFDAALSKVQPTERVRILQSLSSSLEIPSNLLQLSAFHQQEISSGSSILYATQKNFGLLNGQGSQISFPVGCSGEVNPEYQSLLRDLEGKSDIREKVAEAIGYPIIFWQVTGFRTKREKRHVTPYLPTPIPGVRITQWPKITHRVESGESSEEEREPEPRIVPTMASPFFSLPSLNRNHHRHHHGQDVLRRENFPTVINPSPTLHYHHFPSEQKHRGTPVPTPVPLPERPTLLVIKSSVDFVEDTINHLRPSRKTTSEEMRSRWYVPMTDPFTVDLRITRSRLTVEPTRQMPQTPNFKPTINNRMKKLSLVAGKAWSYTIPRDIFVDLEDGNTRDLKLMFMTSQRTSIPPNSWIQFDPENQVMYALPLNDNAGTYEFVLEAMDSEGASTSERVELHVWKHPSYDEFNHEFGMTVKYNKWQYPIGIDWQIEVLNRLARLFGDVDNSLICVKSITLDPVKIAWVNDSLPVNQCPLLDIHRIYDTIATSDKQPMRDMKKIMTPEFRVQDIGVKYDGSCKGVVTSPPPPPNFPPRLYNPINNITITVGDILKFKIPEETFFDFEDGSTRHLRLTLLTRQNVQLPKTSWVQFDSRNQEIYGIAMPNDVGQHYYRLNAMDSDGYAVPDSFVIQVDSVDSTEILPVEFSIHVDEDFDKFNVDANKKTLMAGKIARLYGDMGPQYLVITSINKGSVVYAWSNKSLPKTFCPTRKIDQLVKYLLNEDGSLSVSLIQVMEPEFRVTRADAIPTGVCLKGTPPTFVTPTTTTPQPSLASTELEPTSKISVNDDIYITTIVPAVVIAVMLIIASIVAFFLYRKKRKGKMGLGDKDFIGSGVPVVFAGELEEHKPDPAKAPAIMKNEKPPLSTDHLLSSLPFRRGTATVRDSTPQTTAKVRERPSRDRKETSALYQPPPPFTSSRESKSTRPKSTSTYRHPTYVPP